MDIDAIADKEPPVMDTVLTWIGFDQENTRNRIREEGFESFDDLATMKEKDIRVLRSAYDCRRASYFWTSPYSIPYWINPLGSRLRQNRRNTFP